MKSHESAFFTPITAVATPNNLHLGDEACVIWRLYACFSCRWKANLAINTSKTAEKTPYSAVLSIKNGFLPSLPTICTHKMTVLLPLPAVLVHKTWFLWLLPTVLTSKIRFLQALPAVLSPQTTFLGLLPAVLGCKIRFLHSYCGCSKCLWTKFASEDETIRNAPKEEPQQQDKCSNL